MCDASERAGNVLLRSNHRNTTMELRALTVYLHHVLGREALARPTHNKKCPPGVRGQKLRLLFSACGGFFSSRGFFPAHRGTCCPPGAPLCTEPVHALLFWNMVHVLQQVVNVLNDDGEQQVQISAVLDALQGFATPQNARENPIVEALVRALCSR